jgi:hypothetical protein
MPGSVGILAGVVVTVPMEQRKWGRSFQMALVWLICMGMFMSGQQIGGAVLIPQAVPILCVAVQAPTVFYVVALGTPFRTSCGRPFVATSPPVFAPTSSVRVSQGQPPNLPKSCAFHSAPFSKMRIHLFVPKEPLREQSSSTHQPMQCIPIQNTLFR